ncbi:hypothetical protein X975_26237, partial [Stegodyphus mimosarum]
MERPVVQIEILMDGLTWNWHALIRGAKQTIARIFRTVVKKMQIETVLGMLVMKMQITTESSIT